jgi:hypothetical protein
MMLGRGGKGLQPRAAQSPVIGRFSVAGKARR